MEASEDLGAEDDAGARDEQVELLDHVEKDFVLLVHNSFFPPALCACMRARGKYVNDDAMQPAMTIAGLQP